MNFTYATVDVKTELVNLLKEELRRKGFPDVKVLRSDPATPAEVPCIGVNRSNDDETSQSIGDFHGTNYNKTTNEYVTYQGTFFQESVEVRVWHLNADERDTLYLAVKGILFASRLPLVEKGLLNVALRGGRDEQDTTMEKAPFPIYWSSISMEYMNPLNVEITEAVEIITDVNDNGVLKP
jgi:hypothetical protein